MTHGTTLDRSRLARALWLVAGLSLVPVPPPVAQQCLGFAEENVIREGTNGVESIHIADIDGDGDPDIVSASFGDGKLFWYENDGGSPPVFVAHLVTLDLPGASSVFSADLDGDGDQDLVGASRDDNLLTWYENDGRSPPIFSRRVATTNAILPLSVYAADVDGDGNNDLLSASFQDDKIAWYENIPGDLTTFTSHEISIEADAAASVFAIDVDGDGDTDVLSASRLDDKVAWYENVPSAEPDTPPTFTEHQISVTAVGATAVYAADVDGDGDIDVLSASHADNTIAWYESDGNPLPTFTRHEVSTSAISASSIFVGDVNGDGNLDVLSASQGDAKIAWYQNDGASPPNFSERVISTDAKHADDVKAADLDGDGDLDVVSASSVPGFPATDDKLAWYENDGAAAPGFTEHRIYRSADGAVSSFAADLDGDGDVDVATAGRPDKIAWYESNGAVPTPAFDERVISVDALGAVAIFGADLNADGDIDLLSASRGDDKIAWYENDGAADPQFFERVVSMNAIGAQDVFAIDVDGDGDEDILSASSGDNKIAWYENLDGAGTFGTQLVISTKAVGARSVHAGDIDGDGDTDVLSASFADDKIAWYENLDGAGSFEEQEPAISEEAIGATSVFAVDMDGDGDTDVLAASSGNSTVSWFENDGATPPAFSEQLISVGLSGLTSAIAIDLDADGDQDVIVTAVDDEAIAWFENDGAAPPDFTGAFVINDADFVFSTSVGDVDADGDLDIVAGQRLQVSWFRASGETCQEFDANGDDLIDGVELTWIGRAFGLSSNDPINEWWFGVDYNLDGMIDGNDLAILATDSVFGSTTTDCSFICE